MMLRRTFGTLYFAPAMNTAVVYHSEHVAPFPRLPVLLQPKRNRPGNIHFPRSLSQQEGWNAEEKDENSGHVRSVGVHATGDTTGTSVVYSSSTPATAPPMLMLEGDEFYVSHDGISRTMYVLKSPPLNSDCHELSGDSKIFIVEELYNLKTANKTFILRDSVPRSLHLHRSVPDTVVKSKSIRGFIQLGPALDILHLQEIDEGVLGSAGTGATTWESSIAMALFFSFNPNLLAGNMLELGSGVGLGGILTQVAAQKICGLGDSLGWNLTLSDCNKEVLNQCVVNVNSVESLRQSKEKLQVQRIDWNEFARTSRSLEKKTDASTFPQYDTILASDICYLYPDVEPLSEIIFQLLKPSSENKLHLFGPLNRGALHEFVRELKVGKKMDVTVECIAMERCRLMPVNGKNEIYIKSHRYAEDACFHGSEAGTFYGEECPYASKNSAIVLHIIAYHIQGEFSKSNRPSDSVEKNDID